MLLSFYLHAAEWAAQLKAHQQGRATGVTIQHNASKKDAHVYK